MMNGKMFHQDIADDIRIIGMGFCDYTVQSEDGADMLPPGHYLNLEINGSDVAIPVDMKTHLTLENVLLALPVEGELDEPKHPTPDANGDGQEKEDGQFGPNN